MTTRLVQKLESGAKTKKNGRGVDPTLLPEKLKHEHFFMFINYVKRQLWKAGQRGFFGCAARGTAVEATTWVLGSRQPAFRVHVVRDRSQPLTNIVVQHS